MKPAPFDYCRPESVDEALSILSDREDAIIIAGGQSLLPMLNLRMAVAECLVDISRLDTLGRHGESEGVFSIGALMTHAAIEDGCGRKPLNGLLQRVASKIAYRTIRNMGTIGGSLVLNDPAADWPACMLCLNSTAVIAGREGKRAIPMQDFLQDAYTTALGPDEILLRVDVPVRPDCRFGVSKVTRKSGAFADSLAIAVAASSGQPACVVLTGTDGGARRLARTSDLLDQGAADAGDLDAAIRQDVTGAHEDADPYQHRCHIHTVTSAIAEMNSWSS